MKIDEHSRIEIIAVGNELLTPYYQDSDSLYITQCMNDLGMEIRFKSLHKYTHRLIARAIHRSHLYEKTPESNSGRDRPLS